MPQMLQSLVQEAHLHLENVGEPFQCPQPWYIPSNINVPLPRVTARDEGARIHLDVNYDLVNEDIISGYARLMNGFIERRSISRWIHDTTFRDLDMNSFRLAMLNHYEDGNDNLTPDVVNITEQTAVVIEVTTTSDLGMEDSMLRLFRDKVAKYQLAIKRRTGNRLVGFYVIVASNTSLVTNHPMMTDDMAQSIIYMYRLARKCIDKVYIECPELRDQDDHLSRCVNRFESKFPNFAVDFKNRSTMDQRFVDRILRFKDGLELVDRDIVGSCLNYAAENAQADLNSMKTQTIDGNLEKLNAMISNEQVEFNTNKHRADMKTVIQYPFIVMNPYGTGDSRIGKLGYTTNSDFPESGPYVDDPEFRLWSVIIARASVEGFIVPEANQFSEDVYLDMSVTTEELIRMSEEQKPTRANYHRIRLMDYMQGDLREFAKHGVRGKLYKQDDIVQEFREKSKRRFHHTTDVSDIEDLFKYGYDYFSQTTAGTAHDESVMSLIIASYKQHSLVGKNIFDFSDKLLAQMEDLYSTNLMKAARIIREIAHEIAVSRKQHCKTNDFIIKRLRFYPIWIVIRTTKLAGPTFFSIMFNANDRMDRERPTWLNSVFREIKTNGSICWTEFVSTNDVKLTNVIRADCMTGVYWRVFQEIAEADPSESIPNLPKPHDEHFIMQLMIYFCQKQGPADTSCLTRYWYMEACTTPPRKPQMHKLLSKINFFPRSRLEVFMNTRIFDFLRYYTVNRITQNETSDSHANWDNVVSWINGMKLRTMRQAINYSYHGYGIGRSKHIEANSLGTLVENVTEYEDKMPILRDGLGMGDKQPQNIQVHEYSTSLMFSVFKEMDRHLKVKHGDNYDEDMLLSLLKDTLSADMEGISTLKACSSYCEYYYRLPYNEPYAREKVATKVALLTRQVDSCDYVDMLKYSIDYLNALGILHVCLFPKEQVTGTREIYVLPIEGRLAQRFVEKAARIMCSMDDSEILTHQQNKFTLLHNHQQVVTQSNSSFDTYCTSADKRRWNHGNHVTKFLAQMLFFYPPVVHKQLTAVMSLWDSRRIMIPPKLSESLVKHESINTTSDTVNKIHRALVRNETSDICDGGQTYLKIRHGFMQGILHYTSSFFHGAFLQYVKRLFFKQLHIMKKKKRISERTKMYITTMHSSDDSGFLISLSYENETERILHSEVACFFEMQAKHLGYLLGLYDSPKTASHCRNVFEFNSKFTFGTSTEEPVIRHLNAVIQITDQESMVGRLDEAYSNMGQVIEHGGSFWLTAHFNIYQAIFHYQCLGSSVNDFFTQYHDLIKKVCDPSLGFFLMDDPRCCSMLGMQYLGWINSHHPAVSSRMKSFMKASTEGIASETIRLGISSKKSYLATTTINFGNTMKHKREVSKAQLPDDWRDQYNAQPYLLYNKPSTSNDLLLQLAMKFQQQGVINSFSHGASSEMYAAKASVYALQRLVLCQIGYDITTHDITFNKFRTSIMRQLQSYGIMSGVYYFRGNLSGDLYLTDEDRVILFPNYKDFESFSDILREFDRWYLIKSNLPDRKKRVKAAIHERTTYCAVSLLEACKYKWGYIEVPSHMDATYEAAWEYYTRGFAWLSESPNHTVLRSPFEDHVALAGFIEKFSDDHRKVQLSTAPIRSYSGFAHISDIIKYHFYHNKMLTRDVMPKSSASVSKYGEVMHTLYSICMTPLKDSKKTECVRGVLQNSEAVPIETMGVDYRHNVISFMQHFSKRDYNPAVRALKAVRNNYMGFWTSRQRRINKEYCGPGIWEGYVCGHPIVIFVTTTKQPGSKTYVRKITVKSRSHIPDILEELPGLSKSISVDFSKTIDEFGPVTLKTQMDSMRSGHIPWLVLKNLQMDSRVDYINMLKDQRTDIVVEGTKISVKNGSVTYCAVSLHHRDYKEEQGLGLELLKTFDTVRDVRYENSLRNFMFLWVGNNPTLDSEILGKIIYYNRSSLDKTACKRFTNNILTSTLDLHGCISSRHIPDLEEQVPFTFDDYDIFNDDIDALMEEDVASFNEIVQEMSPIKDDDENLEIDQQTLNDLTSMVKVESNDLYVFRRHPCIGTFLNTYSCIKRNWYSICIERKYVTSDAREVALAKDIARCEREPFSRWGRKLVHRVPTQIIRTTRPIYRDPFGLNDNPGNEPRDPPIDDDTDTDSTEN